ncbi:MAG: NfeD family protein [Thermaurantimonas sp.]|uniref:NfeD-like C-terminal domain-containing protein n=1 Tax=Thermaurantimonas aggregans TaxID=2173829 RepID=A0A401XI79_9FLAO|nr:NfeD family protein [Thermaurantimonas aggregans]MCX8149037.1 NfeD family protein [Thermaurantimonas aggregans]GCD76727.1 hypothetical protein JCM31826_02090 [Thermaurantimonas aggregans]
MDYITGTQWWIIAGILLLILEIFTPAFFAAALAVGCFITAVFSYLGTPTEISWLIFSAVSIITVIYLRPLAKKMYNGKQLKTNAEAMIGRTAVAETDINTVQPEGYVKLDGVSWKAVLADSSTSVFKGDHVKIVGYESIVLKVKKV